MRERLNTMTTYGPAFSTITIDSEPLPRVSAHLLPWLIKDRREAIEGGYGKDSTGKVVHDGTGLDRAQKSLRQAEAALAAKPDDPKTLTFLEEQLAIAKGKVGFYTGKLYLLDKVIAAASV